MTIPDDSLRSNDRRWAYLALAMLGLVFALSTIDRTILPVTKSTLEGAMFITNRFYSYLVSCFLGAYTAMFLCVGLVVPRLGIRLTLTIAVAVMSAAVALNGETSTRLAFIPAMIALGLSQALVVPTITVAIFQWFPLGRQALAYSIVNIIQSTAGILCPSLLAFAVLESGWRAAFVVPAMLGAVVLPVWWKACPSKGAEPANLGQPAPVRLHLRELLGIRSLRILLLARFVSDPLWFFLQSWQVTYLQDQLHMSLHLVGELAWLAPAASMLAVLAAGSCSDRLAERTGDAIRARVVPMLWISTVSLSLFALPHISSGSAALAVCAACCAMCCVWMSLSTVLIGSLVPAGSRASAIGLMSAVGCISSALFNGVAGPLIDQRGYAVVLRIGGCLYVMGAVILKQGLLSHSAQQATPRVAIT